MSVYYALANTRKDFTRTFVSETSIFRLDLSAAKRIYAKKGVVETSFVIAVICVYLPLYSNSLDYNCIIES